MKKDTKKKLSLSTSTIRVLSQDLTDAQLKVVAGGGSLTIIGSTNSSVHGHC